MPPSIRNRLNRRAVHSKEVRTATPTGFITSFQVVDYDLPCRRWPASTTEQETAARVERRVTDVFMFAPEATVGRDDRLELKPVKGDPLTRIYTIKSTNNPSEPGVYLRAMAEEIQTGT